LHGVSAALVIATIQCLPQELINDLSMAAMNLDAVKPEFAGTRRGPRETVLDDATSGPGY